MLYVVFVAVMCTIVRARHHGVPWSDICAFSSKWFNWVIFGRDFSETFSAHVGSRVEFNQKPRFVWRLLARTLDTLFWVKEKNHCAESLERWIKRNWMT